jgi:hypothetical protein
VVALTRRCWRTLLLATVRDRFKISVDCPDWHFHASICAIHFLLTIFADGHI